MTQVQKSFLECNYPVHITNFISQLISFSILNLLFSADTCLGASTTHEVYTTTDASSSLTDSVFLVEFTLQCKNNAKVNGPGGYSVERWVRGCAAQIGCIFSPTGFSMTPFYFKTRFYYRLHFNNGFSFGCVIYHRFLYRLQKIVILKSNYCQGKFHLFFAIEHAQKLKSLVKVAENPC